MFDLSRASTMVVTALLTTAHPLGTKAAAAIVPTHCEPHEAVQFSCRVRAKIVSLCATTRDGAIASVAYRYGRPGQVENQYEANLGNDHRFFATEMPASPGALVRQVWFDRGKTRYLITDCVGGECGRHAGLAVLQGRKLLSRQWCDAATTSPARFVPSLVRFGTGSAGPVALTPLVLLQETDNLLEVIYPGGAPR